MIERVFGNATAEKVLLHVYHYGEIHEAAIAGDYNTAVTPIKNQWEPFENGFILIAKTIGIWVLEVIYKYYVTKSLH